MDKSKSKKKDVKASGGTKVTKKKATTQKKATDNKSSKKKKGAKNKGARDENNDLELQNKAETPSLSVIEQKENQKLEEKLNQPLTKKKLPPIVKKVNDPNNNENNEIEDDLGQEEEVKEDEKIEENKENKEKAETVELSIGTPYFYNITGLNTDLDEKNKKINEENSYQEKYKITLKDLLNNLNEVLAKNVELLYSEEEEETKKQKQENLIYLQNVLYSYEERVKDSIEKNKRYKEQYESLLKKDSNIKIENAKEYEALIEEKKINNNNLNKEIIKLKSESFVEKHKFKANNFKVYSSADELQKLSQKKAECISKIVKSKKSISTYQKELANLEASLENKKKEKNYFNAKVEEDLNRLKEDLTGNEDEILERIENDKTFILRKLILQEKVNSVFKPQSPKLNDQKRLLIKKSLEPINRKAIRYDVSSTYNSRRYNIVSKVKSPIKAKVNTRGDIFEDDLSNIEYDKLTEYEYRELENKLEQGADVIKRLDKSIAEAQKMYSRKLKDIKATLDENSKKLSTRKKENDLLKSGIDDLMKIYELTEKEAKINNSNLNSNNLYNSTKDKNNNNNDEKELESHKEYLSPEYYQSNKNKKEKDRALIPTHSNNDLIGNDSLGLNIDGDQVGNKLNNIKFPDLSNIEEDKGDKMIINNNNNQYDRSKAIDDIKKKYNIKKSNIEDIDNLGIDENDLNFNDENEDKLRKEQDQDNAGKKEMEEGEMMDKESEDEKKFFKEHEKIMKGEEEEGQFEPPIDNEIKIDNNNENNGNENNNVEGNNNEDENQLNENENEKRDQDEVNYKKNDEKENEEKKDENKRGTKYEPEQQHLVDIEIEPTKKENDDNLKDEINDIEKKDDEVEDNNANNENEKNENENEINEEIKNKKEEENEINNDADNQDSIKELDINEKETNEENKELEENNQNEEKKENEEKEEKEKEEEEEKKEIMHEENNENEIKTENENENKKEDNNEENNEQEAKEENNEGQKEVEENKTGLKLETNQNKENIEEKQISNKM